LDTASEKHLDALKRPGTPMATLSKLVKAVAQVEGLDEVTVGIYARAAREAGFISQGGRGRGAAQMTIEDAANLLIAVNGCPLAKDVKKRLPAIRKLPWLNSSAGRLPKRHHGLRQLFLDKTLEFGQWLEKLLLLATPSGQGNQNELSKMLIGVPLKREIDRAKRSKIDFPQTALLQIRFWLARPSAEVVLLGPRLYRGHSQEPIYMLLTADVSFDADVRAAGSPYRGDRAEAVIISDATIAAVAKALRT
jgi:hypothetical protein